MRLVDLLPGTAVALSSQGKRLILVGIIKEHPLFDGLSLVIWRRIVLPEEPNPRHRSGWEAGEWIFDALHPQMNIQGIIRILKASPDERNENLMLVLRHGGK